MIVSTEESEAKLGLTRSGWNAALASLAFFVALMATLAVGMSAKDSSRMRSSGMGTLIFINVRNALDHDVILTAVTPADRGLEATRDETIDYIRATDLPLETQLLTPAFSERGLRIESLCQLAAGAEETLMMTQRGESAPWLLIKKSDMDWRSARKNFWNANTSGSELIPAGPQLVIDEESFNFGAQVMNDRIGPLDLTRRQPEPEPEELSYLGYCLLFLGLTFVASVYFSVRWYLLYTARRQLHSVTDVEP